MSNYMILSDSMKREVKEKGAVNALSKHLSFLSEYKQNQNSCFLCVGHVDLSDRLRTFNVKLPFKVNLTHSFESKDYIQAESLLHKYFSDKRVDGEWFTLDNADIELIKDEVFLAELGIEFIGGAA